MSRQLEYRWRSRPIVVVVSLFLTTLAPLMAQTGAHDRGESPVLWPAEQLAFFWGGGGLLLSDEARQELVSLDSTARAHWIADFLARDPLPDTSENELALGIERREALAYQEEITFLDHRARLLFLHGPPRERVHVDCDIVFRPLEIWTYGTVDAPREAVLYQPRPQEPYRLWLPLETKRPLYTDEMEYFLQQLAELRGRVRGPRFDRQACKQAREVDSATGIDGLFGFRPGRPTDADLHRLLEPPSDLAAWAREAALEPLDEAKEELPAEAPMVSFPEASGQRLVSRLKIRIPSSDELESFQAEGAEQAGFRLSVDGVLESEGRRFDGFRVRFELPAGEKAKPVELVVDRLLRPERDFLVRLRVKDEIGGREAIRTVGFRVPREPVPEPEPLMTEDVLVPLAERMAEQRIEGADSLLLIPPESDVILGLWRAEALVTGQRIVKVRFLLDGTPQLSRARPPFSAELRLSKYPTEQVVRAEGYDDKDELVAADEVILNQQRGELAVRIVSPERGESVSGTVTASAEVVVPEERHVSEVQFLVNDQLLATLEQPPWTVDVDVPKPIEQNEITYLTVVASLDDGSRAEAVRFLNAPEFLEQVEVDLVELYTTVTNRNGGFVTDLGQEAFEIREDGRPQQISKFELVRDLPLTLGITVDTSGSMLEALGEAKRTAIDFLDSIMTPKDRAFAVSFSNVPRLLMPRTGDSGAVEEMIESLTAVGNTALHDAIVTSLYYFRGVRGRRALVLLSDGDDTSSTIPFRDSLEYARRSGVAIYAIGLDVGRFQTAVRGKLRDLARETGGRVFFISAAEELTGVYDQIEEELRSQYLLAYNSDRPAGVDDDEYRTVEVRVKGGLVARTISGYYP